MSIVVRPRELSVRIATERDYRYESACRCGWYSYGHWRKQQAVDAWYAHRCYSEV